MGLAQIIADKFRTGHCPTIIISLGSWSKFVLISSNIITHINKISEENHITV
jgi:hypothetical protein